jgi:hypothetical protein
MHHLFKDSYQQDLNINFESETMLSAQIYLGDSPSSSQILLSTDNYLLRKKDGWAADVAISRGILAQNFGSTLTIQVVNSNVEDQIVQISFSYGMIHSYFTALSFFLKEEE